MQKVLVIRFSSIGDIVLTTPVLRCLKSQVPGIVIHYVTKDVFKGIVEPNPYVDKVHTFKEDISETFTELAAESYDLVIDLHRNVRSYRLKKKLNAKSYSFRKLNVQKYLAVNFKMVGILPDKHIVQRYLDTVKPLGVENDGKGLDYFIREEERVNVNNLFFKNVSTRYIALVAGGSYPTKQIPVNKLREICGNAQLPLVVLGDRSDKIIAAELQSYFPGILNACGRFSINQSASVIEQAEWVITSDTGMMHIASAFHKKIISVWGNTVPEFGMGPYLPRPENRILEVEDLGCRPCSKLGYKKCPRGHFKCMNEIGYGFVKELK